MSTPVIQKRYTLIAIVVLMLIVAFLVKTQAKTEVIFEPTAPVRVNLFTVEQKVIEVKRQFTGRLRAARVAKLHFEIAGRINTRQVKPGQLVTAGQQLLTLEDDGAQNRLVEAKANQSIEYAEIKKDEKLRALAKENLDLQDQEVNRLILLQKKSMASETAVETAKQKRIELKKDLASLTLKTSTSKHRIALKKTAVNSANRNLSFTSLRAPYEGAVNRVEADVGDFVTVNNLIVELVDISSLDLHIEVNSDVASRLHLQQSVSINIADQMVEGKIYSIQAQAKDNTHTHPLKVRISANGAMPGMLGVANLVLEKRPIVLIPAASVLSEFNDHIVFVYRDGQLFEQPVKTGIRQSEYIEIIDGLRVGDKVVPGNLVRLSHGMKVEALD
jgi:RND family efflux transporter MFP subunit